MVTIEELRDAMPIAQPLFDRLQEIYRRLPVTRCSCEDPGICCTFLPEMTVVEAFQWIHLLQSMPDPDLLKALRRFAEFYLSNPVRLSHCPFLADGACTIYLYRTFGCRAYGLWSQEMERRQTRENRLDKQTLRKMWKRLGVNLPRESIEFEPEYCSQVEVEGGVEVGDRFLEELLKQVYEVGKPLSDLQTRFENEFHSDFSFLITTLLFGIKKTLLQKLAIIKELAEEGTDRRLLKATAEISPRLLRW